MNRFRSVCACVREREREKEKERKMTSLDVSVLVGCATPSPSEFLRKLRRIIFKGRNVHEEIITACLCC